MPHSFLYAGTILDQLVTPKGRWKATKSSFSHLQDPLTGKLFRFVTNLFEFQSKLSYCSTRTAGKLSPFSENQTELRAGLLFLGQPRGIKTQVWMVLIANLIFSVIHKTDQRGRTVYHLGFNGQSKFNSYICFETILKMNHLNSEEEI